MRQKTRQGLAGDESGAVAVMFALAAPLLVATAVGSIIAMQHIADHSGLQALADRSALSAAGLSSREQQIELVSGFLARDGRGATLIDLSAIKVAGGSAAISVSLKLPPGPGSRLLANSFLDDNIVDATAVAAVGKGQPSRLID